LISPIFQKVNIPEQPDFVLSTLRLVKSRSEIYNREDLNSNFLIRYKNFIKAPSTHFIYETFFYFLFLMLFSYYMLTEIVFETTIDCQKTNLTANMSLLNQSSQNTNNSLNHILCKEKIIKMPSYFDYVLIGWVVSFICQEVNQVYK